MSVAPALAQRPSARPRDLAAAARVPVAVWAAALAVALRLVYGLPQVGYDAWWSLAWGRAAAHGAVPGLTATLAPTPHPLAILLAAPLSLLGPAAPAVLGVLALAVLAALGTTACVLGARLFGPAAGVLAAALLLTRPLLVGQALQCSVDVPFLALVLGAGAALTRGRDRRALVLLALAGLLRPEAWPLALAAAVWTAWPRPSSSRALAVALALAAAGPVLWALFDLVCTGDPLHSLHGTRELADGLGRPRSLGTALHVAPDYLTVVLGDGVALLGGAAAIAAVWLDGRRAVLPLVVLGAGVAGFLVLGVAGLPLLYRYTLLPAAALALLAAWAPGALAGHVRPALARGGALAVLALLLATVPAARDGILRQTHAARGALAEQRDLTALLRAPAVARDLAACGPARLAQQRPAPQVAYLAGRAPVVSAAAPATGVVLVPVPGSRAIGDRLAPTDQPIPDPVVTARARPLATHGAWRALSAC